MTHSSGGGGDAKLNIGGKEELKRKSSNLMDPKEKSLSSEGWVRKKRKICGKPGEAERLPHPEPPRH